MRATISGEVVEIERKPWTFNGRSGVRYAIYVRPDGANAAAPAQLVTMTDGQLAGFVVGDKLEALPVDVFANTQEYQGVITGAKLSVRLDQAYTHSRSAHLSAAL